MKKYLAIALPFFVCGLLLAPPETSHANIAPKKTTQVRPIKLTSVSHITIAPEQGKEKKKVVRLAPKSKTPRLSAQRGAKKNVLAKKKIAHRKSVRKNLPRALVKSRDSRIVAEFSASRRLSPALVGMPELDDLRRHYQDWRGTRYRAGGASRAGVDCSGFTALTFRDVYGVQLPRSAREQAMRGVSVDRDSLLPGDLVFFKRGRGIDHVGIYLGNGKFMHASSRQGVTISSMNNAYWRGKFLKGSRM
ncbi:MAG: C40 family peptidase [Desulfobulbaceae bacterium]|jgi:cell wall-associated NlpC family hydrolase|nr:C40 family peptidase [Desulfobulbaceae bacterium]